MESTNDKLQLMKGIRHKDSEKCSTSLGVNRMKRFNISHPNICPSSVKGLVAVLRPAINCSPVEELLDSF